MQSSEEFTSRFRVKEFTLPNVRGHWKFEWNSAQEIQKDQEINIDNAKVTAAAAFTSSRRRHSRRLTILFLPRILYSPFYFEPSPRQRSLPPDDRVRALGFSLLSLYTFKGFLSALSENNLHGWARGSELGSKGRSCHTKVRATWRNAVDPHRRHTRTWRTDCARARIIKRSRRTII